MIFNVVSRNLWSLCFCLLWVCRSRVDSLLRLAPLRLIRRRWKLLLPFPEHEVESSSRIFAFRDWLTYASCLSGSRGWWSSWSLVLPLSAGVCHLLPFSFPWPSISSHQRAFWTLQVWQQRRLSKSTLKVVVEERRYLGSTWESSDLRRANSRVPWH